MEDKQDYYCYVHRRKDTGEVFYVGSGRLNRYTQMCNRSALWKQIADTAGFYADIVVRNLTEKQAREIETDFILFYAGNIVNKQLPTKEIVVSADVLRQLFYYDETSSTCLRYNKETSANSPLLKRLQGDEAGCYEYRNGNKHRLRLNVLGKNMVVHRVVYILCNGEIPEGMVIDHIDGDPFNNKINNLRAVTKKINARNTKLSSANTSGVKGVYLRKIKTFDVFVATWMEDGKPRTKAFYVSKYGYDEALRLAIETRMNKIAELEGFTDRGHYRE